MKLRIALIALASAALAFAFYSMRKDETFAIDEAFLPSAVPVENLMRDAITVPPDGETVATPVVKDEPHLGPRLDLSREKLAWEVRIESVTCASDLSETAKSRRLLEMIASLPEHAMTSAAEEAVERLPDADYNSIALHIVANPQTHGIVTSVLFADLMERPDAITLPALLRIARIPNHPYAKFAHDNLDLLIGEDYGADWLKWEAAVQKTLAAEK